MVTISLAVVGRACRILQVCSRIIWYRIASSCRIRHAAQIALYISGTFLLTDLFAPVSILVHVSFLQRKNKEHVAVQLLLKAKELGEFVHILTIYQLAGACSSPVTTENSAENRQKWHVQNHCAEFRKVSHRIPQGLSVGKPTVTFRDSPRTSVPFGQCQIILLWLGPVNNWLLPMLLPNSKTTAVEPAISWFSYTTSHVKLSPHSVLVKLLNISVWRIMICILYQLSFESFAEIVLVFVCVLSFVLLPNHTVITALSELLFKVILLVCTLFP